MKTDINKANGTYYFFVENNKETISGQLSQWYAQIKLSEGIIIHLDYGHPLYKEAKRLILDLLSVRDDISFRTLEEWISNNRGVK